MLALLGYPFLLEPWVATRAQAWGWSAGYVLFVGLCARPPRSRACEARRRPRCRRRARGTVAAPTPTSRRRPLARQVLWCTLAATGSILLLACQQPHHAERRRGAAPVDRAARDLPADLHPLLRRHGLVQARHLPRRCWRRRSASWRGRSPIPTLTHELDDPDRRVLRRPVPRLHVLPRRARAPQAGAALPHALLPDDLARRRARARRSSASSRRWCCPAYFELAGGLVLCALLLLWQVRREPIGVSACSAIVALLVDDRLRDLGASSSSTNARSSPRATSTACCACRRPATTTTASAAS